ncbi:MAG TPA: hypothetical protein ENI23_15700 [bacterium]|nr:hypothetical protein [bacterium]
MNLVYIIMEGDSFAPYEVYSSKEKAFRYIKKEFGYRCVETFSGNQWILFNGKSQSDAFHQGECCIVSELELKI